MVVGKFRLTQLFPLFLLFSAPQALATQCFEYKEIPSSVDCGNHDGKSADFSIQCVDTPGSIEQVEIPCPFRWVNTDGTETHAQVCAGEGLKTTSVGDEVCSSGERRAPDTYNFMYGKWGGVGSSGGDHTTTGAFRGKIGTDEDGSFTEPTTYQYCWSQGQKKDYDRTDIVIAFPCTGK